MSTNVQALLNQRKQNWNKFQQLRGINPADAAIARHIAMNADRELLELGFTVLN
ncbi:MAG: hypothetical protein AAFR31_20025 [Cyanobacteria bacterium J06627_8]